MKRRQIISLYSSTAPSNDLYIVLCVKLLNTHQHTQRNHHTRHGKEYYLPHQQRPTQARRVNETHLYN